MSLSTKECIDLLKDIDRAIRGLRGADLPAMRRVPVADGECYHPEGLRPCEFPEGLVIACPFAPKVWACPHDGCHSEEIESLDVAFRWTSSGGEDDVEKIVGFYYDGGHFDGLTFTCSNYHPVSLPEGWTEEGW